MCLTPHYSTTNLIKGYNLSCKYSFSTINPPINTNAPITLLNTVSIIVNVRGSVKNINTNPRSIDKTDNVITIISLNRRFLNMVISSMF